MPEKTESRGDLLSIFAFGVLFVLLSWLVSVHGLSMYEPFGLADLAIVAFAAFRMAHLLTFDKILEPLRHYFTEPKGRFRLSKRFVGSLVECLWCTGMWAALFALALYMLGPWTRFAVYMFAVAGFASLLQVISLRIANKD